LARALEVLADQSPSVAEAIELVAVGRKTAEQKGWLARMAQTGCAVRDVDYCNHDQVTGHYQSADVLCLLLNDLPGAERVVPAKIFEYLASGKPVLAICPAGEAADIVARFEPDSLFTPGDTAGICRWLTHEVARRRSAGARPRIARGGLEQFSRQAQARQLAELLDQLSDLREAAV